MSARPRPVTATFPPPVALEYHQHSARSRSVSTGSSTASLLSVLEHDSCNEDVEYRARRVSSRDLSGGSQLSRDEHSRESSPIERYQLKPVSNSSGSRSRPLSHNSNDILNDKTSVDNVKQRHQSAKGSSKLPPTSYSPSRAKEINENSESELDNKQHLSAWEQWVLRKAKADRDKLEVELLKQRLENEKAEREREAKEQKKAKAAETIQAWMEEHDQLVKQRLQLAAQRRRAENDLKETKKKQVEAAAEKEYKKWLDKKAAEEAEQKRLKKEQKEREELKNKEKEEKCKKAVEEWMTKAKRRPRTAPNSFGYCSGKLRGYYDASAYPAPSFVNPIPWRPIEIPVPPKPAAKKKAPRPRWNPSKYL